jgi:hypothetical protein
MLERAVPVAVAVLVASTPLRSAAQQRPTDPRTVAVGTEGTLQVGANLQTWVFVGHQESAASTLRIRRAELKLFGEIIPKRVFYRLMFDGAKLLRFTEDAVPVQNQDPPPSDPARPETVNTAAPPADTAPLQDLFVTVFGDVDITAGQFKIPLSYEGLQPSTKLLLPERALVSRYYGEKRDIGIKAAKKFPRGAYVLGVFDGQGPNQLDSNLQKDVALRLEAYPTRGLVMAAVGYTAIGQRDLPGTKDRLEGDLVIQHDTVVLQSEYIHGWERNPNAARIESHGAYVTVAVMVADPLQAAARIGFLDPDVHAGDTSILNTAVVHFEAGLNFAVRRFSRLPTGLRFQLGYALFDPRLPGSSLRHEGIFSTQIAF